MARIHSRKKSRRRVSRRRVSRRRVSRKRVSRRRVSRRRVSRKKHTSRHKNIRKRMHYRMNDREAAISYLRRIKEIQEDIDTFHGNPDSRYLKENKKVYQKKIDELREKHNWGMFSGKWWEIKRDAGLPINDVTNMDASRRPGCIGGTCDGNECAACTASNLRSYHT